MIGYNDNYWLSLIEFTETHRDSMYAIWTKWIVNNWQMRAANGDNWQGVGRGVHHLLSAW